METGTFVAGEFLGSHSARRVFGDGPNGKAIMKSLRMPELGKLEFFDVPAPRPGDGEVLTRTTGLGLFRSEFMPLLRGSDPRTRVGDYLYRGFPFDFAADCVGQVGEVGPGVDGVSDGARVTYSGRIAPYAVARASSLVPIAHTLTDEEATFPIQIGVVLNCIRKLRIDIGDTAVVIGQGPLGSPQGG